MFNLFERSREKKAEKAMYPEQKEASKQRELSSIVLGEGNVLRGRWERKGGRTRNTFNVEEGTINGHKISGSFSVVHYPVPGNPTYHFEEANLYIDGHPMTKEEAHEFSNRFEEYGAFDIGLEEEASGSVEKANADKVEQDKRQKDRVDQRQREERAESERKEQEIKKKQSAKKSTGEKLDL
jgi:hypothetical protein